ncbi:ImmA/IrrE family metallo-endopeptidase [Clostridium tyrobutyricum]|uniref:ImmA/IrrE family metallo-endopeptidase n=1 Tax=Clostridium tyrobutyricum TaxID=1519 RepID=UPI001C38EC5E|nr:ImmA/IrrE family metallo-endopeptidase [Clostridium tyrobutyricum]MBV4430720.1 ImmA/IrrE family metallo-endopeptidase [Clostridium tyrobutyricum]
MYIENYVRKTINGLIEKYGTSNMIDIVHSNKNLCIYFCSLTEDLNGCYKYFSPKRQIVVINEDLSEHGKQCALFHEYGHCVLEHKGKTFSNSISAAYTKEEYEADMVSAYMFLVHNHIDNERINEIVLPDRVMSLIYKFLK